MKVHKSETVSHLHIWMTTCLGKAKFLDHTSSFVRLWSYPTILPSDVDCHSRKDWNNNVLPSLKDFCFCSFRDIEKIFPFPWNLKLFSW